MVELKEQLKAAAMAFALASTGGLITGCDDPGSVPSDETLAVAKQEARSWDRFQVPRPFSRTLLRFGLPLEVPADLAGDALDRWCGDLDREFEREYARVDADVIRRDGARGDPSRRVLSTRPAPPIARGATPGRRTASRRDAPA